MAEKKLYLAPDSSLELMRYLRSTNGEEGLIGKPVRRQSLSNVINTVRAVNELDETAQRWLGHISGPIHAFVPDRSKGTSTKRLVTHVFGQRVPFGAFVDAGHGVCMCTPAFVFMGMSANVDLVDAVSIGMELCGTYSRWGMEPEFRGGFYSRQHDETECCTYGLPPAMNAKRAKMFVERLSAFRGSTGAMSALKWVLDGSASRMETATYLVLCLPKRLGGYGLPKPTLNPKLLISNPDGVKERYPDLFWLGANIDVEYNSDSKHGGEWSRYRDSKREVELTVAHVKVLPLTRQQLMNADEFDAFAQGLRRMLGVRARRVDAGWHYRHSEQQSYWDL